MAARKKASKAAKKKAKNPVKKTGKTTDRSKKSREKVANSSQKKAGVKAYTRKKSDFDSKGCRCSGWLYRPRASKVKTPIIIMAHGFGAEAQFGLENFAEKFCAAGYSVFLFDYRGFGLSDGPVRQLVNAANHVEDWHAALRHVRHLGRIDVAKIALWGTSFSGGHVLTVAAQDQKVATVLAQVPFVDGVSTVRKLGLKFFINAAAEGLKDLKRKLFKQEPYRVKIVSPPGEFAVLNTEESYPGYMSIVNDSKTWQNQCPARILLTAPFYRPIRRAKKINCPVLLVAGEADSLIDIGAVRKAARLIPGCMLFEYPWGHFETYSGAGFRKVSSNQLNFLKEVL